MATFSDKPISEQVQALSRGTEAMYTPAELEQRLTKAAAAGRQLRVKLGLEMSADASRPTTTTNDSGLTKGSRVEKNPREGKRVADAVSPVGTDKNQLAADDE